LVAFAADETGLTSGWQNLGTWNVPAAPVEPLTLQLSPINGSGNGAAFVLRLSDISGHTAVQQVDLLIGNSLGANNSCLIDYWAPTKTVSVRNNNNTGWYQGTLGSTKVLENSQCKVSLASSSVSGSGNTLTLSLVVTFKAAFRGTRQLFTFGADQYGRNTGWQNPGRWTVR
jgi:hypothetical protein